MAQKRLLTKEDVQKWTLSEDFESLVSFIVQLAKSVEGKENQAYVEPISDTVQQVCNVLDEVVKAAEKHPVLKDAKTSRFGKEEFRDFYDEVQRKANGYVSSISDKLGLFEVEELAVYFVESWGDRTRIDYGSGHELNFLCFLYGLTKQGVLDLNSDATNIVLKIFLKYLDVMRILETKYWLEPAGSHGVWGLDDYHFLPFLFGAFQLATHKHLVPKSIHNPEVVELFEKRYCYFGCIAFINSVKTTASLRWHSPMLDDISGVKTWRKVAEGMVKMYKVEVLTKLPIMQHFYFGTFLKAPEDISPPRGTDSTQDDIPQTHHHNGWGDCCGIPIPSAIAASQLNKKSTKKTFV